jgi:hypothetical protein
VTGMPIKYVLDVMDRSITWGGAVLDVLFLASAGDRKALIELDWTTRRRRVIIPAR